MDFFKSAMCLFVLLKHLDDVDGNCILSLKKDFGSPAPVYLKKGEFLEPNSHSGDIYLRKSETVLVSCPGDRGRVVLSNDTTNANDMEAQCLSGTTFRAGRWVGEFKEIRCNTQPWFTTQDVGPCHGRNRVYSVGYKIREEFYSLYEACFDKDILNTLYVKHHLSPLTKFAQSGLRRPQFIEGNLFGKTRMSHLYKVENQKDRINELLGQGMDQEYLTKQQFLTRGHLAPKADFTMFALQRASFQYVNSAPQWMKSNRGDWAALEDGLRRRVQKMNTTLVVYTGTQGVLTMETRTGRRGELHLAADANNNGIVSVPLYFYKLVYDPQTRNAAAFVNINSSFYNKTMTDKLTFCNDICDENPKFSWLKWRADGARSFCCSYDEFVDTINYLPRVYGERHWTNNVVESWHSRLNKEVKKRSPRSLLRLLNILREKQDDVSEASSRHRQEYIEQDDIIMKDQLQLIHGDIS